MQKHKKRTILKWALLILAFALLAGYWLLTRPMNYLGAYLSTSAWALQDIELDWKEQGRPTNYDMTRVLVPTNNYFVFTNTVTISNQIYHCCFGVRKPYWPPGTMAITDGGMIIWIRDRDGKITVDPQKHDVER